MWWTSGSAPRMFLCFCDFTTEQNQHRVEVCEDLHEKARPSCWGSSWWELGLWLQPTDIPRPKKVNQVRSGAHSFSLTFAEFCTMNSTPRVRQCWVLLHHLLLQASEGGHSLQTTRIVAWLHLFTLKIFLLYSQKITFFTNNGSITVAAILNLSFVETNNGVLPAGTWTAFM